MSRKILLADSDLQFSIELSKGLHEKGFSLDHVTIGRDAQGKLGKEKYSAVVLNYDLQNFSSFEVLNFIKNTNPFVRVIMVFNDQHSMDETDMLKKKASLGLSDVFMKMNDREKLLSMIVDSGAGKKWNEVSQDMSQVSGTQVEGNTLSLEDSEFFNFEIDHLVGEGLASFDTYIKLSSGRYLLLVRKGDYLIKEQLSKYINQNVKFLYYKCSDRSSLIKNLTFELSASMGLIEQNPKKVSNLLRTSLDLVFDEIALNGPQSQELAHAKDLIKKTQDIVRSMPDLQVLVNEFFSKREIIKQHSLFSCLFTSIICQNVDWLSPKLMEEVCLGAYLQNIGLSRLNKDSLEVTEDMTEEEKDQHLKHPIGGYRFLQYYPVSEKVRQIVLQHHESCDGKGYPFGLRLTKIYPPAKIVYVASELSELMLKNNLQPKEALTLLVQTTGFREKYDPEMIRSLIKGFIKKKK